MTITFTPTGEGAATFTFGKLTEGSIGFAVKDIEWSGVDGMMLMSMGKRDLPISVSFRLNSDTAISTFRGIIGKQGTLASESWSYPNTVCDSVSWGTRNMTISSVITVEGTATFRCLRPDQIT